MTDMIKGQVGGDMETTALQFLIDNRDFLPMSIEKPCTTPTNGELRRWLDQSSVLINGTKPNSKNFITFPITQLVFFPKSNTRKTTIF